MVNAKGPLYALGFLTVCLVFYLTGPYLSSSSPDGDLSNAEARMARWLDAVVPPRKVSRSPRTFDPPVHPPSIEKAKPLIPFSPFPLDKPVQKHERRSLHETGADSNEVVFSFQKEVELPTVRRDLASYAKYKPHNFASDEPRPTFATLLSTRNGSLYDPYFAAAQSLVYRMLWAPETASTQYPFTVFVLPFVSQQQRAVLAGAGAIIKELEEVKWEPNSEGVFNRLRAGFSKLHMWALTEFSRIAFLDSDAFPIQQIDALFQEAGSQKCETSKLTEAEEHAKGKICAYVFAGVRDPGSGTGVNAGVLVLQPNEAMHQRLMTNYKRQDHYDNRHAEQGFLNWQFSQRGAFPAGFLPRTYNGLYPQASDKARLKVVHDKIWAYDADKAPWLSANWNSTWQEMVAFYDSERFSRVREKDGLDPARRTSEREAPVKSDAEASRGSVFEKPVVERPAVGKTTPQAGTSESTGETGDRQARAPAVDPHGLSEKQLKMLERQRDRDRKMGTGFGI